MSLHIPFRSYSRKSQSARVGGVTLRDGASSWLNVDSPRVNRDLAKHAAIGGIYPAGAPLGFTSDGYLTDGAVVTKTAASLVLNVTASFFTRANGVNGTHAADTVTATAGGATGPRLDIIAIDTNTPDIVKIDGTTGGVVNANIFNRLSLVADLPANRIPIALLLVPASAANLDTATLIPLR